MKPHRDPVISSHAQPLRISRIRVRIRNSAPTHLVARASLASQVLALLRVRKESATPPMAPDRPALWPDWKSTTRRIATPQSSCKIGTMSGKVSMQDYHQTIQPCHTWCRNATTSSIQ